MSRSRRPSAVTGRRRESPGGCLWGAPTTRGPGCRRRPPPAVSGPAQRTALEVLAANNVETIIQSADGFAPTPAISRAILVYNRGRTERLADGVVITPSHNPPEDGGFKYNPPNGGPAESDATG